MYVRGLPPSTQEHKLLAYFCMFGPVEKVVYDEKKSMKTKVPAFAIVEFVSADTARSVATYGQHVINSQRIEIKNCEQSPTFHGNERITIRICRGRSITSCTKS